MVVFSVVFAMDLHAVTFVAMLQLVFLEKCRPVFALVRVQCAGAAAERTAFIQRRQNCRPDELGFIGDLFQSAGDLLIRLEGDNGLFHGLFPVCDACFIAGKIIQSNTKVKQQAGKNAIFFKNALRKGEKTVTFIG